MEISTKYFKKVNKEAVRNVTLDLGTRLDGRKTTEIETSEVIITISSRLKRRTKNAQRHRQLSCHGI
jgi:polyribonucleotide nucleotidyltransferase